MFLVLNDYTGIMSWSTLTRSPGRTAVLGCRQTSLAVGIPRAPVIPVSRPHYMLGEFSGTCTRKRPRSSARPRRTRVASLLEVLGLLSGRLFGTRGPAVILVSNVRVANYYDPSYPYYIAGFYSPTFEAYFDRNIIR
jgi:hypothetical protein